MRNQKSMKNDKMLLGIAAGVLSGAIIGAVVSLLTAPQSGKENRAYINRKARQYAGDLKESYVHAKDAVVDTVKKGRKKVKDMYNHTGAHVN